MNLHRAGTEEQDVEALDVSVDDALLVHVGEAAKDLAEDAPDLLAGEVLAEPLPVLELAVEVAGVRVLEHYVQGLGGVVPEVAVARDDVRVV